jgi:hypothetical protein
MKRLNRRLMIGALCISGVWGASFGDTDAPVVATTPIVTKPVKKHPKKHRKTVAQPSGTPKVMVLSNDDLPKRHNYSTAQDPNLQMTPPVPANNVPMMIRSAPAAPTPAPAPTNPYSGIDAASPRLAPSSDPADLPTPDASAIHSTTDLNKAPPTTSIH